jgi:hypothetical protein
MKRAASRIAVAEAERTPSSEALSGADLFALAMSRRRARCEFETTYSHASLANWLRACALPEGWSVVEPRVTSVSAPLAEVVSAFPIGSGRNKRPTAAQLAQLATFLAVPVAEAKDILAGHCETVAFLLAARTADAVRQGSRAPATDAMAALVTELRTISWGAQVALVFDAEHRARASSIPNRTAAVWAPLIDGTFANTLSDTSIEPTGSRAWCAGCPGASERVRAVAAYSAARAAAGQDPVHVCPLFVLNYIFDRDELDQADMRVRDIETAQYSVHVVGLVMHGAERVVHIADPNGALLPGGNIEFLHVPFTLRVHSRGTTSVSQFDIDSQQRRRRRSVRTSGEGAARHCVPESES